MSQLVDQNQFPGSLPLQLYSQGIATAANGVISAVIAINIVQELVNRPPTEKLQREGSGSFEEDIELTKESNESKGSQFNVEITVQKMVQN